VLEAPTTNSDPGGKAVGGHPVDDLLQLRQRALAEPSPHPACVYQPRPAIDTGSL
jgi:hypothetical protein